MKKIILLGVAVVCLNACNQSRQTKTVETEAAVTKPAPLPHVEITNEDNSSSKKSDLFERLTLFARKLAAESAYLNFKCQDINQGGAWIFSGHPTEESTYKATVVKCFSSVSGHRPQPTTSEMENAVTNLKKLSGPSMGFFCRSQK